MDFISYYDVKSFLTEDIKFFFFFSLVIQRKNLSGVGEIQIFDIGLFLR